MNRRKFLTKSGIVAGVCMTAPYSFAGCVKRDAMSRIGMTTCVFRYRFSATSSNPVTDPLSLEKVPEYFSQRFNIRNIEFWTAHFESREKNYLQKLKAALSENGCTLINIQIDTPGLDISDPDKEKRGQGIQELQKWIDAGEFLETKMVRLSGMRKSIDQAIESVRVLAAYAAERGITVLVENHGDMFVNPELHTRIAKEMLDVKNFGLIADFGNYPESVDKYAALKMIAPYTKLVSAKTKLFDRQYNHISYDFDPCIKVMENEGYKGIYSLEQYASSGNLDFDPADYDYERIADWMIERVKANI